jgi:hypothetical protein
MVDDELHAQILEELKLMGAFLYGRVSYELMAGFLADRRPREHSFREGVRPDLAGMPKVLYRRPPPRQVEHHDRPENGAGEVEELKLQARADLVVGGGPGPSFRERGGASSIRTSSGVRVGVKCTRIATGTRRRRDATGPAGETPAFRLFQSHAS